MAIDPADAVLLHALEEAMWRPETRFDRAYMDAILEPGFVEIGQSGRVWTREETLGLGPVPIDVELPLRDFTVDELAPGLAHIRYVSVPLHGSRGAASRSSLWRRGDRWRAVFHQATGTST